MTTIINNTISEIFPTKLINVLAKANYTTLDQLCALDDDAIKSIKGVGPVSFKAITDAISDYKMQLASSNEVSEASIVISMFTRKNRYSIKENERFMYNRAVAIDRDKSMAMYRKMFREIMMHERNMNNAYKAERLQHHRQMNELLGEFKTTKRVNNSLFENYSKTMTTEIVHDIPMYNRGDATIRTIIQNKIVEEYNSSDDLNDDATYSNYMLNKLVEESLAKLDESIEFSTVLADIKDDRKFRPGMVQCFKTLKFSLNDLTDGEDGRVLLNSKDGKLISISESNITVKLSDGTILSDVFVMRLKHDIGDDVNEEKARRVIVDGVLIDGEEYVIFLITPSQKRSGHIYLCPASKVVQYRKIVSNGVDLEGMVMDIDKLENRIALGASNGTILCDRDEDGNPTHIYYWDTKVIDDVVNTVNIDLVQPLESVTINGDGSKTYQVDGIVQIVRGEILDKLIKLESELASLEEELDSSNDTDDMAYVELEAYIENTNRAINHCDSQLKLFEKEVTDGYGLIDIRTAAHWSLILGCINKAEYKYFVENFKSLDEKVMVQDCKLLAIFNRIPSAYQVRHHFDKGLLVIWDLVNCGTDTPILLTKGMHKRDEEPESDDAWRVCNYNKKKAKFTCLTIQAIQALGLKAELLYKLVDETVTFLVRAMNSVEGAIDFLNLKDEDERNSNSIQSQLLERLNANPKCFMDEYIQTKLYSLVEKQLHDMVRGKLITTGAYYYMITDPRCIFGSKEQLASDEYFLNNNVGEVTAVRYPCINMTEPQKLNLVQCNELWFLKDLLVFNIHDGRWCGMGGADFDGDIAQVLFDMRIIDSTVKFDMITDIVTHTTKFKDLSREVQVRDYTNNYENRAKMYLKCYNGSEVGLLTDYSTKYTSKVYHSTNGKGFINGDLITMALMWTFIIGKEIDKAKTNEQFVINPMMQDAINFYSPDFMMCSKLAKMKLYDANLSNFIDESEKLIVKSNCPMGKCVRYIVDNYGLFTGNRDNVRNNILQRTNVDGDAFLKMIGSKVPLTKAVKIEEDMKILYDNYKVCMSNLFKKYDDMASDDNDYETIAKERNNDYDYAFNYFKDQFEIICKSQNYNEYTATWLLASLPYIADKNNKGKFVDEKKQIKYKNTSKSCVWNVADKYILNLLRSTNTNGLYIEIPDAIDGDTVIVENGVIVVNGVNYKFDRLVDGEYTATNNSNGSFICATKEQLSNARIVTEQDKAIEYNENSLAGTTYKQFKEEAKAKIRKDLQYSLKLTSTYNFVTGTPMNALYNLIGREFTVSTHTVKGITYPCIKTVIDDEEVTMAGLLDCAMPLVGQRFVVENNIMDMCDFYATKGRRMYDETHYVRETVSFMATKVGVDSSEVVDEGVVYDCCYKISHKDIITTTSDYDVECEANYDTDTDCDTNYDTDTDCDTNYDNNCDVEYDNNYNVESDDADGIFSDLEDMEFEYVE